MKSFSSAPMFGRALTAAFQGFIECKRWSDATFKNMNALPVGVVLSFLFLFSGCATRESMETRSGNGDIVAGRTEGAAAATPDLSIDDFMRDGKGLCDLLRDIDIIVGDDFEKAVFNEMPTIQGSLRECLANPEPIIKFRAALLLCKYGDVKLREFMVTSMEANFPEKRGSLRDGFLCALASAMIVELSPVDEAFLLGCVLGDFGFGPRERASTSLMLNRTSEAVDILERALAVAQDRGDDSAIRTIKYSLAICKQFGAPPLSAQLSNSWKVFAPIKKVWGANLTPVDVTLNAANDAASVLLTDRSPSGVRHNATYLATFRMINGVWRLVYFTPFKVT